ncbi:hypothetical protein [Brachybacterium sp. UNK5269]|uniref:hypothetical protein n=1 Tax=Brachybacterium sp. UNK5269 TaxID=3408576 RepID=UPI003BB07602
MTVTVDGKRLDPDPFAPPWRRSSFRQIVDRATTDRTTPARVEVRKADGTTFTDIIAARRRRSRPEPEPEPEEPAGPVFHTVEGDGFVFSEDVAVAVVIEHTGAAHTGTARALIDRAGVSIDQAGGVVEVILFGRVSDSTIIRRVP